MNLKKIFFDALLSNTDSSIQKVVLKNGFEIKSVPFRDYSNFLSRILRLPIVEVDKKLFLDFHYESKDNIFLITNSFDGNIKFNQNGSVTEKIDELAEFHSNLVEKHLKPLFQKIRLFKEGNISIPLLYYYFVDNNSPTPLMVWESRQSLSPELFTLKEAETSHLNEFLKYVKLPFEHDSLQIAFEDYELSYQITERDLSFLILMIGLEILLNKNVGENIYQISRNCATLLGEDDNDSQRIFYEMKDLYDKRSKIIHQGKKGIVNEKDLFKLRHYLRESIKEIYVIGKNKDDLLELLNSYGFGDQRWKK